MASDAVKRRTLPAWIREGLEKMDREKQRKLERERMEKERADMAVDDGKPHEADEEGDGPRIPRKSKFVSNAKNILHYIALKNILHLVCWVKGRSSVFSRFVEETRSLLLFISGQ